MPPDGPEPSDDATRDPLGAGPPAREAASPQRLVRVGPYRILGELGRGGMGVVWRAEDENLQRFVALKALPEAWSSDARRMEALVAEARHLAKVSHPNVATVYGLERDESRRYIVMELVDGESLEAHLRRGSVVQADALRWARDVAAGVAAAHARGVVHRDLKPGNVRITPEGRAKVLDFGLASEAAPAARAAPDEAASRRISGTPGYMSPQQAMGEPGAEADDAWAFGRVLLECLIGKDAGRQRDPTEALALLSADVPRAVRSLIARCVDPSPSGRPTLERAREVLERAAAAGRRRPASSLPRAVTSLVGRDAEIAEVLDLLEAHRSVSIIGPAGSGKTRLALAVAEVAAGDVDEGPWFVELAAVPESAFIPAAVAGALGLIEGPRRSPREALMARLSDSRGLLVLDNAEHLAGGCAELVDALLVTAPGLQVLVTSRERLGHAREASWDIPPLQVPEPAGQAEVEALADLAGVRLFVERARAAQPHFALTSANASPVMRCCAASDGLPLVIELLASRVGEAPLEELVAGLDVRRRGSAGPGAGARHRTLRAALDWSIGRLLAGDAVLLRRLGVFAGSFELDEVEAACAFGSLEASGVADGLDRLADASLVRRLERAGRARLQLLEVVRQHGREQVEASGETEGLGERHAATYLALAERAAPHLLGHGQAAWLTRLDADADDMRAAVRWFRGRDGASGRELRLLAALARWFEGRAVLTEGRAAMVAALASHDAADVTPARARVRASAGLLAYQQGDLASARELLEGLADDAARLEDPALGLVAQARLGIVDYGSGRPRDGVERLARSLAAAPAAGGIERAQALAVLGACRTETGDSAGARAALREARDLAEAAGALHVAASALSTLGVRELMDGDVRAALDAWDRAIAILRDIGARQALAQLHVNVGRARASTGDVPGALEAWTSAAETLNELGDWRTLAVLETNLAMAASDRGHHAEAARHVTRAITLHQRLGDAQRVAETAVAGATMLVRAGGHDADAMHVFGSCDSALERLGVQQGHQEREWRDEAWRLASGRSPVDSLQAAIDAGRELTVEEATTRVLDALGAVARA